MLPCSTLSLLYCLTNSHMHRCNCLQTACPADELRLSLSLPNAHYNSLPARSHPWKKESQVTSSQLDLRDVHVHAKGQAHIHIVQ